MGTRVRLVVLAIAALGIIATDVPGASAAGTSPVPVVGQCYNYSLAKGASAASSPSPAISCSKHHTAVTFYVGTFTGAAKKSTDPKSDVVLQAMAYTCNREVYAKEGAKVALTRAFVGVFSFDPTPTQWASGARFFRCDLTLWRDSPTELQAIPAGYAKALKTKAGLKKYAWCFTKAFATVPCTATHATKALTYVTLGKPSAKFPGSNVLASRTTSMCKKAVSKLSKKKWVGVYWRPNAQGWATGFRTATCFQTD